MRIQRPVRVWASAPAAGTTRSASTCRTDWPRPSSLLRCGAAIYVVHHCSLAGFGAVVLSRRLQRPGWLDGLDGSDGLDGLDDGVCGEVQVLVCHRGGKGQEGIGVSQDSAAV